MLAQLIILEQVYKFNNFTIFQGESFANCPFSLD